MDRTQQDFYSGGTGSSGVGRTRAGTRGRNFAQNPSSKNRINKKDLQRWIPAIAGGALAIYGLSRRSKTGLLLAGGAAAFAYQGTKAAAPQQTFARSSVLINADREKVFQFWRRFENLPLFMHHLETVTELGNDRSRWIAIGPAGARIQWDAVIVAERPNELIAWRSLPDSEVQVDGTVEFRQAPGNRGTLVDVIVEYLPPMGALGRTWMKLLGKDPSFLMRQDLGRLRALIETGEIPTTDGQTHGPRSAVAAVARIADPDRPMPRNVNAGDVLRAQRRIS